MSDRPRRGRATRDRYPWVQIQSYQVSMFDILAELVITVLQLLCLKDGRSWEYPKAWQPSCGSCCESKDIRRSSQFQKVTLDLQTEWYSTNIQRTYPHTPMTASIPIDKGTTRMIYMGSWGAGVLETDSWWPLQWNIDKRGGLPTWAFGSASRFSLFVPKRQPESHQPYTEGFISSTCTSSQRISGRQDKVHESGDRTRDIPPKKACRTRRTFLWR